MNRQWLVAVAVIAAVVLAVGLFLRRDAGTPQDSALDTATRIFADDSLGVRMRIPESPGWTLRRPPANADGLVAVAAHEGGRATVRVLALPLAAGDDLEAILQRRKAKFAQVFGTRNLDDVVVRVLVDERQDINGRPCRQWQAMTAPVEVPGEEPESVMFLWLLALQTERSVECLGMLRFPTARDDAEAMARSDSLLRDIVYVLQSFEVR